MCKASLIFSWKDVEAVSRIEKQSSEHIALHVSDLFMCWTMCEFLSVIKCSQDVGLSRRHSRRYSLRKNICRPHEIVMFWESHLSH